MKFNLIIILSFLFAIGAFNLSAQQHTKPLGYEVAGGLQTYYAPFIKATLKGTQPVFMAGVHQPLNVKNSIGLTLRLGYNRHVQQGDALFTQLLFNYTPLVAKKIELGIGAGVGYQFSFYPSTPLKWNGTEWFEGKAIKAVIQVPAQVSIGYRGIETTKGRFTPYVSYQLNALFNYTPDLTPLPSSFFLLGVKYSAKK
ncbi:hypothetical protein WG954_21460 [Lacibacter sp. H375]|uniref:hypothetical protein n=1 Tax=Lacibacter sp. H375 TaxID=3133424 RepID=UPI0030BC2DE3